MKVERTTIVKYVSLAKEAENVETAVLDAAAQRMAREILGLSQMYAPVLTGALRANGKIETHGLANVSVVYGDTKVPYARRRHYENHKNPQTLLYLQRAGDQVTKKGVQL